ncbi:non-homologous end-joining DNA ligase [Streptomyces sp. NPDC047108]|uniref:non-homologous end-joining DNA ligase n=1 Tax=Streptomyces sp. NPDC047108 TaxID=3155025 RepID=UPI0033CA2FC5
MSQMTEVEGRRLALSNLDKVLYPDGFTKGEVLHYYATVAGAFLPHLRDRPLSFLRYPDGSEGEHFFAKNLPLGTPDWVRTAVVPRSGAGETGRHVLVQDLPTLIWAANLVTEFHTPQWLADAPGMADRLVFDLDPGAPATIVECCTVARWLRDRLAADGLEVFAKSSGAKGLHILAALEPVPSEQVTAYAKALAVEAEHELRPLAIHRMARKLRSGKVFVDWSQNTAAKTTAAPYTLRARPTPTVSAPVTWEEVEACAAPEDLVFEAGAIVPRLEDHGDLLAPLTEPGHARPLPGADA